MIMIIINNFVKKKSKELIEIQGSFLTFFFLYINIIMLLEDMSYTYEYAICLKIVDVHTIMNNPTLSF